MLGTVVPLAMALALAFASSNLPGADPLAPLLKRGGADALILATEWRQYRSPDFGKLKALMSQPILFDGRNLWDPEHVRGLDFKYPAVGRP